MEYAIHRISLDIRSTKTQANINVKQADTARKIYITLTEGGFPYHIAKGCSATFSAEKPDGNYIHNVCQIDGDTIIYTFTEQTVPVVGSMDCEISLYDSNENRITSPHFNILVEERVYNGEEIVSSPEANVLDELIGRAEHAVAQAEGVADVLNFRVDNTFANAFKGKISGAAVQADDVSPIEHTVGCKVRSRNLFNTTDDYKGYTHSYDDGTLTVSGQYTNKYIKAEEGKTYTFSCNSSRTGTDGGGVYIRAYTEDLASFVNLVNLVNTLSPSATVTIPIGYPNIRISFYGFYSSGGSGVGTYTDLMLEEGSVATGYVPYIDDLSTVKVTRCRRNLLPAPELESKTTNGITFTVNADKSVTCNGTATANATFRLTPVNFKLPLGNYKLVGCPSEGSSEVRLQTNKVVNETATSAAFDTGAGGTLKVTEECTLYTYIAIISGQTVSNITFKPMLLMEGDTDSSYEVPFFETFTATADGTVNAVTSLSHDMTILTDTVGVLIDCEYNRDSNKVYEELYNYLQQGGLTGPAARIANIVLLADAWVGTASPYSQVVAVSGVTANTQVDLTPSVEQLAVFHNKDLAFVTENEGGVVTVYAVGQKPTNDYTIQATLTEVEI